MKLYNFLWPGGNRRFLRDAVAGFALLAVSAAAHAQNPPPVITVGDLLAAGGSGLTWTIPEIPGIVQFQEIRIVDAAWATPTYVDLLEPSGALSDRAIFFNGAPPPQPGPPVPPAFIWFGSDDEQGNLPPPMGNPPPPLPPLPPWFENNGPLNEFLPLLTAGGALTVHVIIVSDTQEPGGTISDSITLIVPGPGSLALLGLAAGFGRRRRRR